MTGPTSAPIALALPPLMRSTTSGLSAITLATIVEREGLAQISDSGELESIVAAAIEANPEAAEQIRAGNGKAIGAIVGAVMKETKGRADGGEVNRLIRSQLGLE